MLAIFIITTKVKFLHENSCQFSIRLSLMTEKINNFKIFFWGFGYRRNKFSYNEVNLYLYPLILKLRTFSYDMWPCFLWVIPGLALSNVAGCVESLSPNWFSARTRKSYSFCGLRFLSIWVLPWIPEAIFFHSASGNSLPSIMYLMFLLSLDKADVNTGCHVNLVDSGRMSLTVGFS